jgi:iron transport multicopper oxidase
MLRSTSIVRHNTYGVWLLIFIYCEQHWHGILQQTGSNWADGPSFISQCPIAANDSFLYDFQTVGQAGTYWYHSHLCTSLIFGEPPAHVLTATQYCDGLRGALILYDPSDPHQNLYDIDDGMLF